MGPVDEVSGWSAAMLAEQVGVSDRTVKRWRAEGIPESKADDVAAAAGEHPAVLWPDLWEDAEQRRRRRQREWVAKRRAEDPERRARERAYRRRYYAECGDYERARERRRYQQRKAAA